MVEQFSAPPINPIISIRPLTTASPGRDAPSVPNPLAGLPPGTTLTGFVVNRDAQGNPVLRTSLGDLQIQSDVFVKTGSELVIRVDATSESRARIITIDGVPPQDYATQNLRGALTQDTIMQSQLLQSAPPAQAGMPAAPTQSLPISALFVAPLNAGQAHPLLTTLPPLAQPLPATLLNLPQGAALTVNLVDLQLPPSPPAQAAPLPATPSSPSTPTLMPAPAAIPSREAVPGATQAPALAPALTGTTAASPAAPALANPALPPLPATPVPTASNPDTVATAAPPALPGNPLPQAAAAVSIRGGYPSTLPAPMPTQPAPNQANAAPEGMPPRATGVASAALPLTNNAAPTLPAIVIGQETGGATLVQTHIGVIKLPLGKPLPVHSHLTLQITPDLTRPTAPQLVANALPGEASAAPLTEFSRQWPGIEHVFAEAEAQQALGVQHPLPLPPIPHLASSKLASGLLFFMAAVKGGDLRQWMGGRAVDALESRLPGTAARLQNDLSQMQQLFLQSPIDQWSGMLLPMIHQGQIEYARFYLRRDAEEDGAKETGQARGQRFLVEVQLSHLGDMQFDGFVRQTAPKKQFDLVVRTARALEPAVSQEIRQRFDDALGATGYQGYIVFQLGAQHFVRPLAGDSSAPPDTHTILA